MILTPAEILIGAFMWMVVATGVGFVVFIAGPSSQCSFIWTVVATGVGFVMGRLCA